MPRRRLTYADALAHLMFGKSLSELEPAPNLTCSALSTPTQQMRSVTNSSPRRSQKKPVT
jgi:hypothetical protein